MVTNFSQEHKHNMSIVQLVANATSARLVGASPSINLEVYNLLSYMVDGAEHSKAYQQKRWDGRASFFNGKTGGFPAGFYSLVLAHLTNLGVPLQAKRLPAPPTRGPSIDKCALKTGFELTERYKYQREVSKHLVKNQQMICQAATGCHAKGTGILMHSGEIRRVEDVMIGDRLMGPDSKPRSVLELHRGIDEMFEIRPIKGKAFVVNVGHILSLRVTNIGNKRLTAVHDYGDRLYNAGDIINISVRDYLKQSKTFKHCAKLWRTGVEFEKKSLPIPPYILGIWLGDGTSASTQITSADDGVLLAWEQFAKDNELLCRRKVKRDQVAYCVTSSITSRGAKCKRNVVLEKLRKLNLTNNKHIPQVYKASAREDRLELLAGILDTDGYLRRGFFDIVVKQSAFADDIVYLARSLGLAAYVKECKKGIKATGFIGTYFRISISGNTDSIPCRLGRRVAGPRKQVKNVLNVGFDVLPVGPDEYFGFSVTDDNLYLLDDFTATHNSGKSAVGAIAYWHINRPTLFLTTRTLLAHQMRDTMLKWGEKHVGIMGDGEFDPNKNGFNVATVQTLVARLSRIDPHAEEVRLKMVQKTDKKGKPVVDRWKKPVLIPNPEYQLAIDTKRVDAYARKIKGEIAKRIRQQEVTRDRTIALLQRFEFLIFEEAHEVGSDGFYRIANACTNAHYRLALTATPFMRSSDESSMRLMAASGPVGYRVTEKQLIDLGILATPKFKFIDDVPRPPDLRASMTWGDVQKVALVENKARNERICAEAARAVQHGLPVLILVIRRAHGELLQSMFESMSIRSSFILGSTTGPKRAQTLQDLSTGEISVLIGSTIADVGIDLPSLGMVILAGGGKTEEGLRQRIGRALRAKKNGPNVAFVVDFADQHHRITHTHASRRRYVVENTDGFSQGILPQGEDFDWSVFRT